MAERTYREEGHDHVPSGRDGLAVLEAIMAVYASHQAAGRELTTGRHLTPSARSARCPG